MPTNYPRLFPPVCLMLPPLPLGKASSSVLMPRGLFRPSAVRWMVHSTGTLSQSTAVLPTATSSLSDTQRRLDEMFADLDFMNAEKRGMISINRGSWGNALKNPFFERFASLSHDEQESRIADLKKEIEAIENQKRVKKTSLLDEYCRALEALPPMGVSKEVRLSTMINYLSNYDSFEKGVIAMIKDFRRNILGKSNIDKSQVPMPTIIGTSGEGKTELLLWLVENSDLRTKMFEGTGVRLVVPLFATFNQDSTFNAQVDQLADTMLAQRFLFSYYNKSYDKNLILDSNVSVQDVVELVRRDAAAKANVEPKSVAVLMLVDEIRKIVVSNTNLRSQVLDVMTTLFQSHVAHKNLWTVPIVTCLDITTIFDLVTRKSQRPLYGLRLDPCPVKDVDTIFQLVNRFSKRPLLKALLIVIQ